MHVAACIQPCEVPCHPHALPRCDLLATRATAAASQRTARPCMHAPSSSQRARCAAQGPACPALRALATGLPCMPQWQRCSAACCVLPSMQGLTWSPSGGSPVAPGFGQPAHSGLPSYDRASAPRARAAHPAKHESSHREFVRDGLRSLPPASRVGSVRPLRTPHDPQFPCPAGCGRAIPSATQEELRCVLCTLGHVSLLPAACSAFQWHQNTCWRRRSPMHVLFAAPQPQDEAWPNPGGSGSCRQTHLLARSAFPMIRADTPWWKRHAASEHRARTAGLAVAGSALLASAVQVRRGWRGGHLSLPPRHRLRLSDRPVLPGTPLRSASALRQTAVRERAGRRKPCPVEHKGDRDGSPGRNQVDRMCQMEWAGFPVSTGNTDCATRARCGSVGWAAPVCAQLQHCPRNVQLRQQNIQSSSFLTISCF